MDGQSNTHVVSKSRTSNHCDKRASEHHMYDRERYLLYISIPPDACVKSLAPRQLVLQHQPYFDLCLFHS